MGIPSEVVMLAIRPLIESVQCSVINPSNSTELKGLLYLCTFAVPGDPSVASLVDTSARLISWSFVGTDGGAEDVVFLTGVYSYEADSDLIWVKRQIFISLRVVPENMAQFDEVFGAFDFSREGVF